MLVGCSVVMGLALTALKPTPEGFATLQVGRDVRAAPVPQNANSKRRHPLSKISYINATLLRIRDSYVDPSRLSPKLMLMAALDNVELKIPEVLIESIDNDTKIKVSVGNQTETFHTDDIKSTWRLTDRFRQIFRFIEIKSDPSTDLEKVEYAAVNGLLGTLDPHSVLLDPELAAEMDVNTGGEFGGLGIVIRMVEDKLTVIKPMPDTPASKAGVLAGDVITKIGDDFTLNLTVDECINRMRGKPGSPLLLTISRKNTKKPLAIEITRAIIKVASVDFKELDDRVGYVKISSFSQRTAAETSHAIKTLEKAGSKKFILDLRGNPGGLLEQAIQVSDLFIDKGTLVTTVGGEEREPRTAASRNTVTKAPIAVLVNENSASASEIVAGALKNLNRAVVIGSTTFGKGSVQILYNMRNRTKLKLTIAEYLTPGDLSIQGLGISPDIRIQKVSVPTPEEKSRVSSRLFEKEVSYAEKSLKSTIHSRYAKKLEHQKALATIQYVDQNKDVSAKNEDLENDFLVSFASDFLNQTNHKVRSKALAKATRFFKETQDVQNKALVDDLNRLDLDWSAAPPAAKKSNLLGSLELTGDSNTVKAGATITLKGSVTNIGTQDAYQVRSKLSSHDKAFDNQEFLFGHVAPGQTRSWERTIKLPDNASTRLNRLSMEIFDTKHSKATVEPLKFSVIEKPKPLFSYQHQLLDDGNGDGLVQANEPYRLRVTIENTGKGTSEKTVATLRNASGVDLTLTKARFTLGKLNPGEKTSVDFELNTRKNLSTSQVAIELSVMDRALGVAVSDKLAYRVNTDPVTFEKKTGSFQARTGTPLREGASTTSNPIAKTSEARRLKLVGESKDWYKVQLSSNAFGFVEKKHGSVTKKISRPSKMKRLWQVTPPTLALDISSYETTDQHFNLKGKATDDRHVEDIYVVVSNKDQNISNKKVFYKSNRGSENQSQVSFDAKLPLWPGANSVTVVAREHDGVQTIKKLYLYRSDKGSKDSLANQSSQTVVEK